MSGFRDRIGDIVRNVVLALVFAVVAAIAFAGFVRAADEFVVETQAVADRKAVFATIEATDETSARARIGGTVAELSVDEGDAVEAGQVIGRIGDPKLALELRAMAARIESLRARTKLARIEANRARQLRAKGAIAQSRLDEAETTLKVAQRNLSAAEAERAVTVERQAEGVIRAPASGRVLRVVVTQGKVVLPGESIAVITANAYILRLQLPERHARFIKPGDTVIVGERGMSVPAADGAAQAGRIVKVYPEIRQGRVIADLAVEGLGDFYVGERVRVLVAAGERKALVIPEHFISHRFGLAFVRLKQGGDTVVQPGLAAAGNVEILSGLAEGDVIVAPAPAKQGTKAGS